MSDVVLLRDAAFDADVEPDAVAVEEPERELDICEGRERFRGKA